MAERALSCLWTQDCQRPVYRLSTVPGHRPKANTSLQPVITDFCIYLFLFPDWAVKGLVLVICVLKCLLVGRPPQRHCWNWVMYDLWPGSANISTQLATQHEASSSHQVISAGSDSAQGLKVSSKAPVQEGDRRWKAEVFCRPHSHRSYPHWLLPGPFRLLLPGEESKKQGSQRIIQP